MLWYISSGVSHFCGTVRNQFVKKSYGFFNIMTSSEDFVEIHNWKRERVLGSGGFGTVTLWKQKDGDLMIALKKYRGGADTLLSAKQQERWRKEVDIMQRLKHPNVVRALPLPEELTEIPSELPILCMEFCVKGDLRQLLNRPENCCGLPEADVRRLILNVSSAVHYLHSEKITHRDLKPENIVLSESDSGIVYKLIDLGYAKELDQSSICTSFVGTLQYLAPELFTNEKYSSSVDYWSLGLVSHEVITGIRPFLPSMAPVAWMKHVKKKSSEHICAYQTPDGRIEFSSHLFPQNHISRVLKIHMEKWLRLALEWDPKKRGRTAQGELIVFSEIEKIISKKVMQVFSMVTYERLSYEVEDSTQLSEIRIWIEADTNIAAGDQELLLASGQQLDPNGTVKQCFNGRTHEALYVCKRKMVHLPIEPPSLPELVANLLQSPREKMEYVHQRRAYSHSVFFLQQENKLYRDFLVGCRLKLLSVVLECQKVVHISQKVMDLTSSVSSLRELCLDAFKFDFMQAKKLKLHSVTSGWQHQMDAIDCKWSELYERAKTMTLSAQKATKAARKLQTSDSSKAREDVALNSLLEESLHILDRLRKRPNSEKSTLRDSLEMVKVLYNSLKQRDCLLHNQGFNAHLKQLVDCESELRLLLPELEKTVHLLELMKQDIVSTNQERQRSVWDLLASSVGDGHTSNSASQPVVHDSFALDPPFLSHSLSSSSLYNEENPPPIPHYGAIFHKAGYSEHGAAQSSMSNGLFRLTSQCQHHSNSPSNSPALDALCSQQSLGGSYSVNGGTLKETAEKGSISLVKEFIEDDVAHSIIYENKLLRAKAQELIMENLSHFNRALIDDQQVDWSFLKTT